MPRLSKADVSAIIQGELTRAEHGYSQLADNRREALDYIYGRARGDEISGRSQVVSTDVADMISAVMSQIMPGLAGTDFPASFPPNGPNDDEQAQAESMVVSRAIMSGKHGYGLIYKLAWNALALKNGWAKVWVEDKETVVVRELDDDTTDQQKAQLLAQPLKPGAERSIDGTKLRGTMTTKALRIASVAPENMLYPEDAETIEDARFIAERKLMTRSELLELGYPRKVVMELPAHTLDVNNINTSRKLGKIQDPANAPQPPMDTIEVYEYYTRIDVTGNGLTELMRYIWSNREILDSENVDFVPYATGSPWPIPERLTGMSLHDKLKSVQDISTALWRSTLDNFAASVFQEVVVSEQANVDDFLNRRPAGVNRVEGDVRAAVMGMPITPQVDAGLAMMQHLKGVRAERGGSALEMATGEMQLFESQVGSQGLDRTMSVQEQVSGMVARNMAEGLIKQLYLLVHRTMRAGLREPIPVLMAGEWQMIDPRQFRPRDEVALKAGLTQGEQSRKQAAIGQLMQLQQTMLQAGMANVLVDVNGLHTTIMDFARSSGIDSPERYFIDPQSNASKQAQQGKQQQIQQEGQQQQQMQAMALKMEAMDRAVKIQELKFKYWEAQLKSEVEEAKIIAEQVGALELAELNAVQGQGQAAGQSLSGAGPQGQNGTGA